MPGVKAITVCRECGAPRDPKCRMAFCTKHAKAFRDAQNAKHHTSSQPRNIRMQEAYDRLHVKDLIDRARVS